MCRTCAPATSATVGPPSRRRLLHLGIHHSTIEETTECFKNYSIQRNEQLYEDHQDRMASLHMCVTVL
jgi:hypothetical protein